MLLLHELLHDELQLFSEKISNILQIIFKFKNKIFSKQMFAFYLLFLKCLW